MVLLTAINNFLHPILFLTLIFSLKSMNVGYELTGYILSGLGVGGIIGSMIAGHLAKRFKLRSLVLSVNILRVLVFAGFIFFPSPIGYFVFIMMKVVLGGIWSICYHIYSMNELPFDYVARVSALSGIIIKIFTALGGFVAGYIINYFGGLFYVTFSFIAYILNGFLPAWLLQLF